MEAIESEFENATAQRILPGVLLAASTRDGSVNYSKSFGNISPEVGSHPLSSSTTVVLASATKIVTSVAVMQSVERGLVNLDDDISVHLPEWKNPMILMGFDEKDGKKPILVKSKVPITLRHLLSHTSGITGLENEQIMEYYGAIGNSKATLIPRYFMSGDPEVKANALGEIREIMGCLTVEPLIFEPGTKWGYGQSTDWAGQLVERVTHMTLEDYCQQNIFAPLGMTSTTYRPLNHPHIVANLMRMHARNKEGKVEEVDSIYPLHPKTDMGGSNLYTSGHDFIRFLVALLNNTLLRPETADLMFNYRLPDTEEFRKFKTDEEEVKDYFGEMAPEGMQIDHCLAGLVVMDDLKGGRRKGSVNWQGASRCYWWIDRTAGICGFYGSQIMVMGEQQISAEYFRKFEKAVYTAYGGGT